MVNASEDGDSTIDASWHLGPSIPELYVLLGEPRRWSLSAVSLVGSIRIGDPRPHHSVRCVRTLDPLHIAEVVARHYGATSRYADLDVPADRERIAELIINYAPSDRYQIASAIAEMILARTIPLPPTAGALEEDDYHELVGVFADTLRRERYETLWALAYRDMR